MAEIFLSYARENFPTAKSLAAALSRAGHKVWWDRDIKGGSQYAAEIENALAKADAVVVLWSRYSASSPWVRDEAGAARDSARLVPASLDGTDPPMGFRQYQAVDLSRWKGRSRSTPLRHLTAAIDHVVSGDGSPAMAPQPKARQHLMIWSPRLLAGLAAVVLFLIAGGYYYWSKPAAAAKPTIALLPFTTTSSDAELRQLASQARDSIAHTFTQSGLPLRRMDEAPKEGGAAVDYLISGDLSRSGDKIVATVRLDEAKHRVTVFSDRFEAPRGEARDLPERIGAQMAGNLTWTFPLMLLDRRRPVDSALLTELLQGADFSGSLGSLQTYQNTKRVAAKAPKWQSAQIALAFETSFVLGELPRNERAEAVAEARRAAERAIALGPEFGDTYAAWCVLRSETLMAECEDRMRAGKRIDPDAPFLNTFLSHLLRTVGRFDEAMDLARLAHAHDTYLPTKIGWMLRSLEYDGESMAASELYQKGARWWPDFKPMFFRNRLMGLILRGDFTAMQRLEREIGSKDLPPGYHKSDALVAALKAKSIPGAVRSCPETDTSLLGIRCMLVFAMLGDQDRAYAIADQVYPRRVGRTPAETERIWLDEPGVAALEFVTSPAAAPMRRDPRYRQLAQRVGLLDYWRSGRAPDFCGKQPEPICRDLLARN